MFAFALWDRRRRRLLLARDRAGEKPLYYAWCGGRLLFGSEIKATLAWPGAAREADLDAVHHFLTFQYVPAPRTAFAGVRKLEPGAALIVEADGRWRTERYWSLPRPARAPRRPRGELLEETRARFEEAVRLRLVSDVPLGAFLSGGVDSSAVVAAMAKFGPVKSFSIGFENAEYDERRWARVVAERYGCEHHEYVVRPDALAILPSLVWHYGDAYADSSAVATWYVSEIARRHVTVALSGDGGDEAFLGYARYAAFKAESLYGAAPAGLRRALARLAAKLKGGPRPWRGARRLLLEGGEGEAERYEKWLALFSKPEKRALYGERLRGNLENDPLDVVRPLLEGCGEAAARAAYADIHTNLPDDLLVKVDVASMAHGLESRAPFLDHELLEFAAGVPAAQRMPGFRPKALLKQALEPVLPRELLYRPKMGFGVPIDDWFRGPLGELARDCLLDERARARGLFRADEVRRLLDEHRDGQARHHYRLWALLMLELWFRAWIDGAEPPERPAPPPVQEGRAKTNSSQPEPNRPMD
jgi:asparagine synthase (glutamine-hydrolysing)